MKHAPAELARRLLQSESLAEQRRQTIEALHRKIAALEEKLGRRDDLVIALRKERTEFRRRLRRIALMARTGKERKTAATPLLERAVGE